MLRASFGALSLVVAIGSAAQARAGEWSYESYDQDGVRWHMLALEDRGYRLAFFCHGPGDGIKLTLRTAEPMFLPTAFSVDSADAASDRLRIGNREVIAGPYPVTLSVDDHSRYALEFYYVAFYGTLARNDAQLTISDLLDHLRTARALSLVRLGGDQSTPERPVATFDLEATEGRYNTLLDLCGDGGIPDLPDAGGD